MSSTTKTPFKFLLVFIALAYLGNSCKKIDNSVSSLHEENFVEKFFTLKAIPSPEVASIIEQLKYENERAGFVNKLPANCGLPIWDEVILPKPIKLSDINTDIILPLTITEKNLSSIIVAHKNGDGYNLSYYSTDELYYTSHKQNLTAAEIKKAENDLRLFFFLENRVFGTTMFYHIPENLFAEYSILDKNGNKTISLKKDNQGFEPNSFNYAPCTEWEIWYNPDGDACFCSGDEYDTGERLWTGDCSTEPFAEATWIVYFSGNNGCAWCVAPPQSGGGSGGGVNCNGPFYSANPNPCYPPPPPPPPPPDTTSVLTKLKNYSIAINHVADSVFQLSMVVPQKEFGFIVVKNNQNTIYPKNIKTDNEENDVKQNWLVQNYETLLGDWHSHQDVSTNLTNRPGPSHGDILALNSHGHQTKLHYTSFIDCGNVRFAFVIEDVAKANAFFRNVNSGKIDVVEAYLALLGNNPNRSTNYQLAGQETTIGVIGQTSVNGITLYKSTNPEKTEYQKLN